MSRIKYKGNSFESYPLYDRVHKFISSKNRLVTEAIDNHPVLPFEYTDLTRLDSDVTLFMEELY